ncbi:Antibiotic biosynthesis monooxygenase [Novosphingobium resinovorum]|uniref:Antibiotic biosynthesis monooxygenase n=1 Tax=Novosphingobium resinovorum TaxID=158500 RepID=A0A031JQX8_9SPHN|nr:antibiotic biosynthesis monooxygenase family protein [Novosphingobium resinovorum]EZP79299.1 Antibiotic biosynthesis monooxygenase [Novosphingobium resinovorum]
MDYKLVTLEFHFQPGIIDTFIAGLPALLEDTRKHEGFIEISAHRHHEDTDKLILVERWESAGAHQRYLQYRIDAGMFDELAKILVSPPKCDKWESAYMTVTGAAD